MKELRVILVDDSPLMQEYIKHALLTIKGCKVVGVAGGGDEGLSMIRTFYPDVVVLDVWVPAKGGLDVLENSGKKTPK